MLFAVMFLCLASAGFFKCYGFLYSTMDFKEKGKIREAAHGQASIANDIKSLTITLLVMRSLREEFGRGRYDGKDAWEL